MPRIPFLKLGSALPTEPPRLASFRPELSLDGLQLGIDNLRHDVWLSPQFCSAVRDHIAKLIATYGGVETVIAAEPEPAFRRSGLAKLIPAPAKKGPDTKQLFLDLLKSALNRAKADNNLTCDLLARVAVLKFLRLELNSQFGVVLDRCRATLRSYEGVRQQKALEYRETVAAFQIAKKNILRQAGQELLRILRELERENLAATRRSLFGEKPAADYQLFLTRLALHEDGRDSYLLAEHYALFGCFENDADSIGNLRALVREFLKTVASQAEECDSSWLEDWMCAPENAHELVGTGERAEEGQKPRLQVWIELLEREKLLDLAVAAYEVIPLLPEFTPLLDPQQLKYALVFRKERDRVEKLAEEHGRLSVKKINAAAARVSQATAAQRAKVAARLLRDFLVYYRDLKRLELLNAATEKVSLISSQRLAELSKLNGTLYGFLLPHESRDDGEKVVLRHVILKADVRDSSRVTRSLLDRGMNPASYFSLNFYDPVNKLLQKYGATKVFVEGDAIILALVERQGEPGLSVARACVLAREIIDIVGGYNHLLQRAGLPALDLGVGISCQETAPTYLLDGEHRIMISDALNESDRLSSCHKRLRKALAGMSVPFHVYEFRDSQDPAAEPVRYNLGGVRISEAAFNRLRQEISLTPATLEFPRLWGSEEASFYSGLVPVGADVFRRIVVRASRVPMVETASFSLTQWTESRIYEICVNPAVYSALEKQSAAGR